MTERDGLLDEIEKLKKDLANDHMLIQMLLAGGTVTNKRIDVVEALAMTMSVLVQTTARVLESHLDALRNVPDTVPVKEEKKEHPEFG